VYRLFFKGEESAMKKKLLFISVSCLMMVSVILASCNDTTPEQSAKLGSPETSTVSSSETTITDKEDIVAQGFRNPDEPKYGGTYTFIGRDLQGFDPAKYLTMDCGAMYFVSDYAVSGDWTKGPAGTNEIDWTSGFVGRYDVFKGAYAESWEIPDMNTLIFHVRKGVYFEDKPPVNGREMDAYDFEYSWNRAWFTEGAYHPMSVPADAKPTSIKALDKWTVEVKVPEVQIGIVWVVTGAMAWIYPHEVIDEYGDMTDWKNLVSSGPFTLTDYVSASSITYTRNPNYWEHDPFNPENQLPYVDEVKSLILTDTSTQLAALRTGQVDKMSNISWEDHDLLMTQCPELQSRKAFVMTNFIWGRIDKENLPFKDVKVRQAMNMAINKQEIIDDYYNGNAVLLGWPFLPSQAFSRWYTPLEEMPQDVQDLFTYNPERAKELLTEAGYPDGFKTTVVCDAIDTDFLSIIKNYLDGVNIDMQIQSLEGSVFASVLRGRTHEEMIYKFASTDWPARMRECRIEHFDCHSFYDSLVTREMYNSLSKNLFDSNIVDSVLKEYGPFILKEAIGIYLPMAQKYIMWWPWLQNYQGETVMGYSMAEYHARYIWIDADLKASMSK